MNPCGPDDPDCAQVLEQVYLYLDGELPTRDEVRIHLDDCAPCLRQYGLEQAVKTLVARCCGSDPVPIDLRDRVLLKIQQVRVQIEQVEYRLD